MEIINPNTLPGDNSRMVCSTDAMMPPHYGNGGGCGVNSPCPNFQDDTCYDNLD